MKSIIRLFVFVLLIVGWGLAALSLHVVRTPDQIPITLVTKDQFGLADTYVDTRNWTIDNVADHQLLVQKLIRGGKADVLRHLLTNTAAQDKKKSSSSSDVATQLSDALQRAAKKGDLSSSSPSKATQPTTAQEAARELLGWLFG